MIAYEPSFKIDKKYRDTIQEKNLILEIHSDIRNWLRLNVSDQVAEATRILYGGSINAKNSWDLI